MNKIILIATFTLAPFSVLVCNESQPSTQATIEKIGSGFGELVEAYEKGRHPYPSIIYDFLDQYVSREATVLDIGCGSGKSTRPLFERFQAVYGIDQDAKMLEYAKRNSPEYAQRYQEGSVYTLPYKKEEFDLVTMASSFHWFFNEKAVREISRVLKKGGYIYVIQAGSAPFKEESGPIISSITGHSEEELAPHKKGYNPQNLLTEQGFTIIENKRLDYEQLFTVEDGLLNYQSHSYWHFVKESNKEEEVLRALRKFLESKKEKDGFIHVKAKANVLLAKKTS